MLDFSAHQKEDDLRISKITLLLFLVPFLGKLWPLKHGNIFLGHPVDTLFRMVYTLYLPFVEGLKLSEDDGVVFLSNGNEDDVVIDLVTAERSGNICHCLLRNFADYNM